MTDIVIYAGLFFSALTSATILPGSSEAALLTILAAGHGAAVPLVMVATVGNVLGSLVNWGLGYFFSGLRGRRWVSNKKSVYDRAVAWYERYGSWSLLLSWLPVIGDPLTVAAGALRINLIRFLVLVSIGKFARYVFIVATFAWWNGA